MRHTHRPAFTEIIAFVLDSGVEGSLPAVPVLVPDQAWLVTIFIGLQFCPVLDGFVVCADFVQARCASIQQASQPLLRLDAALNHRCKSAGLPAICSAGPLVESTPNHGPNDPNLSCCYLCSLHFWFKIWSFIRSQPTIPFMTLARTSQEALVSFWRFLNLF
jgi:hypothetical protein